MARRVVARSAEGSPGTALEAIDVGTAAYDQGDYTAAAAAFRTALKLPGAGVVRDRAKGAELTAAEEFCAWFNLAEALAASGGEQVVGEAYDAVEAAISAAPAAGVDARALLVASTALSSLREGDAARWAAATAALPAPRKPASKGGGGLGGWISYQLNIKNSRTYKTLAERRFVKEDDPQ